jgi:hypothetical protein
MTTGTEKGQGFSLDFFDAAEYRVTIITVALIGGTSHSGYA